jgi:GNAT superfamily N-acetyltransferase
LSTQAGWNQREEDWRAAIELTPGASFCAAVDSTLVGTCIGISYGDLSWIAMMLVDPEFQRRGLGAELLLRAIEALPADRPIGLDATTVGRLLYEQHGFVVTYQLTRWIAERTNFADSADVGTLNSSTTIRQIARSDLPGIAAADRGVFGADRVGLLEWALAAGPECCAIATIDEELAGYVFGRTGRVFTHVGTVVARAQSIAEALVRYVTKSAGAPIGIDAFDGLPDWTEKLKACGFEAQRPLARMIRPPAIARRQPDTPSLNGKVGGLQAFSIFGPEFA